MKGYEYLLRFLNEQGIRKSDDKEGRFAFEYGGNRYYVSKEDSPHLKVSLLIETDGYSRTQMLEACDMLNSRQRFVKFTVYDYDSLILCSHLSRPSKETNELTLNTILQILDIYSDELIAELDEQC